MEPRVRRVSDFSKELRDGPQPSDRSIKEIIDSLRPQLQELGSRQVQLAKSELAPVGKRAGLAAGLLAAGAFFLLLFLVFFCLTAVYFLNQVVGLSLWLSALIVSGILLLIGGLLAGVGASILRSLDPKPHRTIRTLQENVNWVKGQMGR